MRRHRSAALELRSASYRHPQGLANGSDVVGRYYMRDNNSVLMAVSRRSNPTMSQNMLASYGAAFAANICPVKNACGVPNGSISIGDASR